MPGRGCRARLAALLAGYIAYLALLFNPRTSRYTVEASLAVLAGLLVYMAAGYLRASCGQHPGGGGGELTRTPVG
ncbi:hypothetical protein CF15_01940 [Pyrodictium occultum]|uniref:Uncharacterized protein n=1 Tax=Pyrodictium occultum TaxID=2309 RepID=A0A0V8RU70_PYROC|nr:hypothetical protein [Pyrodictium occultum]KSW11614.1 hypothetical protein CF15_01940 [Pyrodictium occultum]